MTLSVRCVTAERVSVSPLHLLTGPIVTEAGDRWANPILTSTYSNKTTASDFSFLKCRHVLAFFTLTSYIDRFLGLSALSTKRRLYSMVFYPTIGSTYFVKYIFCENPNVRGFIWPSSALHNFLRCHLFRTIPSLNHHEFGKW